MRRTSVLGSFAAVVAVATLGTGGAAIAGAQSEPMSTYHVNVEVTAKLKITTSYNGLDLEADCPGPYELWRSTYTIDFGTRGTKGKAARPVPGSVTLVGRRAVLSLIRGAAGSAVEGGTFSGWAVRQEPLDPLCGAPRPVPKWATRPSCPTIRGRIIVTMGSLDARDAQGRQTPHGQVNIYRTGAPRQQSCLRTFTSMKFPTDTFRGVQTAGLQLYRTGAIDAPIPNLRGKLGRLALGGPGARPRMVHMSKIKGVCDNLGVTPWVSDDPGSPLPLSWMTPGLALGKSDRGAYRCSVTGQVVVKLQRTSQLYRAVKPGARPAQPNRTTPGGPITLPITPQIPSAGSGGGK